MSSDDDEDSLRRVLLNDHSLPTQQGMGSEEADEATILLSAQQLYINSGNDKKLLCVLSAGLTITDVSEDPLFDCTLPPWDGARKKDVKPSKDDLKTEVERRAKAMTPRTHPKPKYWSVQQCWNWLNDRPLSSVADITFLRTEVARQRQILLDMQQERASLADVAGSNWVGNVPHLRLILCFTEDDCRQAYLTRNRALSREELDQRNSPIRPQTAFEMIADRWNSISFNPTARPSECHPDFSTEIDCSHSKVENLRVADATRIENYLTDYRTELLRIIRDWERSGQGEGGRSSFVPSPDGTITEAFGALANRPAQALQSRQNFIVGRPSYLLYFWDIADENQLLYSCLSCIDKSVAVSNGNQVPSVITRRRRRRSSTTVSQRNDDDDDDTADTNTNAGLQALAHSQSAMASTVTNAVATLNTMEERRRVRQRIDTLVDQHRSLQRDAYMARHSSQEGLAAFHESQAKDVKEEIGKLQEELNDN